MSDETAQEAAVGGLTAASRALRAYSRGEPELAFAAINATATHAEAAWCSAYLLESLRETLTQYARLTKQSPTVLFDRLADSVAGDSVMTQAGLIVHEAERDL